MKRETFNLNFTALVKAFLYSGQKIDPETQDVYWTMLKGIPDDNFISGVKHCLAKSQFFPTIYELGSASLPTARVTVREPTRFRSIEMDWTEQIAVLEKENKKISFVK